MKIALIGAGGMATSHLQAYRNVSELEVAAVCDINEEAVNKAAEYAGCPAFKDIDEMLDTVKPDAVDICIPSFLHFETAMKCLKRNLHVFCEKPMAHTYADAVSMMEEAKNRKLILQVGQILRFWPEYIYLKKSIEEEKFGKLLYLFLQRQYGMHPAGSWYLDPERCKMVCFEMHIHDADFVNHVFGMPDYVDSIGVERPDIHCSYILTRYLYHDRDTVIQAEGGWNDSCLDFGAGFRAVFEHGVLEFKQGVIREYPANGTPVIIPMEDTKEIPSDILGVVRELKEFAAQIRGEITAPTVSPESSANTILLVEKEKESAAKKTIISCK